MGNKKKVAKTTAGADAAAGAATKATKGDTSPKNKVGMGALC